MDRVSLGEIINVRGLKGEVKIQSTSSFSKTRYVKGNKVILFNPQTKDERIVTVVSFSRVSTFDYVKFEEIIDCDSANKYRGYEVQIETTDLPILKDQYYFYQLLNLEVIDQNDNKLGKVIKVEEYPSSCVLRVKGSKEFLIPFVKEFIKEVNLNEKYIKINNMEGLI